MEKCLIVYNPQSGKGKFAKNEKYIVSKLSEKYEVEVCYSTHRGHIGEIILEKGEQFSLLVVAGGDGTLNEAVNSICRISKKPVIGYIPTGTVNDVAHSLGIPKHIKKAVKIILDGKEFRHDTFKMNDRFGIYVCCSGFLTDTSYATSQTNKKKMGKIAYGLYGIKKIFSTKSIRLKINFDNCEIEGNFAVILIINSKNVAGFRVNKRAVLNDGTVDVALVRARKKRVRFIEALRVGLLFLKGLPKKSKKNVLIFHLNKFSVETPPETIINMDGEKIGNGSFTFETIKEGVTIKVKKTKK